MLTGREMKQIAVSIHHMQSICINGAPFVQVHSVVEVLKTFVVADDLAALMEEINKPPTGNGETKE